MKQNLMQKKVYIIFLFLSLAILLCFVIFFISVLGNLQTTNQKYVEQIADSALTKMDDVFLNLEYISVSFSNNEIVQEMLVEEDMVAYHEKASEVKAVLTSIYQSDGLVDNILIYDMEYHYYRLRGELGNTACDRVGVLLSRQESDYLVLELTSEEYMAYITNIYDGAEQIGYLIFLIDIDTIETMFEVYDSMESIQIGIAAEESVIVANTDELEGCSLEEVEESSNVYINQQIGYTPFQVIITDKDSFLWTLKVNFFVLMFVVASTLVSLMLFFYKYLNKIFFRPMISVIDNVEHIIVDHEKHRIQLTGEEEFDVLVNEINSMIDTLDENTITMLQMQYEKQTSEIEKQKMEIDVLKEQINVHFIVNTISVIRRLNELGNKAKVGEMCSSLSDLLRYANNTGDYVECVEGLHIVEAYLEIMSDRYSNKFTWRFEIDECTWDLLLPRMILQPIVENALTHGIELITNGEIEITANVVADKFIITVSDNGIGMGKEELEVLNDEIRNAKNIKVIDKGLEHIALINIQKRVIFFSGEEYGLTIESVKGIGTKVILTLPVLESEDIIQES